MNRWRYAYCQKIGLSHEKWGEPCRNAIRVAETPELIAVTLADGIGQHHRSRHAAEVAVRVGNQWLLDYGPQVTEENLQQGRIGLHEALTWAVDKEKRRWDEEMNCTVAFLLVNKAQNTVLYGGIGHAAVCILRDDGHSFAVSGSRNSGGVLSSTIDRLSMALMPLDDRVRGFIVTSGALEGEVYAEDGLLPRAEAFFDTLSDADPQGALERSMTAYVKNPDNPRRDADISMAVVGREDKPIAPASESNPNTLCDDGADGQKAPAKAPRKGGVGLWLCLLCCLLSLVIAGGAFVGQLRVEKQLAALTSAHEAADQQALLADFLQMSGEQTVLRLENGSLYIGETREGKPHGEGALLENGMYYIGRFREGVRQETYLCFVRDEVSGQLQPVTEAESGSGAGEDAP